MGGYALREAANENLVAMCDVDENRAGGAFKKHGGVPKFKDFRVMMDKMGDEIDAGFDLDAGPHALRGGDGGDGARQARFCAEAAGAQYLAGAEVGAGGEALQGW